MRLMRDHWGIGVEGLLARFAWEDFEVIDGMVRSEGLIIIKALQDEQYDSSE